MAVQRKIEDECSLSQWDWELFLILFHPQNEIKSLEELRNMTITQLYDYKEALDSVSLLKTAVQKDAEQEEKLRGGG